MLLEDVKQFGGLVPDMAGGESWRLIAWGGPADDKQADLLHRPQEKLREF